jgi:hypothetical protein
VHPGLEEQRRAGVSEIVYTNPRQFSALEDRAEDVRHALRAQRSANLIAEHEIYYRGVVAFFLRVGCGLVEALESVFALRSESA